MAMCFDFTEKQVPVLTLLAQKYRQYQLEVKSVADTAFVTFSQKYLRY